MRPARNSSSSDSSISSSPEARRRADRVHGKNRISYRIDRRLSGLAGPDYDATISFGLPIEPEDYPYGKYRLFSLPTCPDAVLRVCRLPLLAT